MARDSVFGMQDNANFHAEMTRLRPRTVDTFGCNVHDQLVRSKGQIAQSAQHLSNILKEEKAW